MANKKSIWHIECGTLPACECGRALEKAHTTCSHWTREQARDGARKLKAAGWTSAHVVKGSCPTDVAWQDEKEKREAALRAESEAQVPSAAAVPADTSDPTEGFRRLATAIINAAEGSREWLEERNGQVWDTEQLQQDFSV